MVDDPRSSDQEIAKAQAPVALFANRFQITVTADITRIAFGEAIVGMDATYRTAIVMRTIDAMALAETLKNLGTRTATLAAQEKGDQFSAVGTVSNDG